MIHTVLFPQYHAPLGQVLACIEHNACLNPRSKAVSPIEFARGGCTLLQNVVLCLSALRSELEVGSPFQ